MWSKDDYCGNITCNAECDTMRETKTNRALIAFSLGKRQNWPLQTSIKQWLYQD